jgi:hypothetical protein
VAACYWQHSSSIQDVLFRRLVTATTSAACLSPRLALLRESSAESQTFGRSLQG